jgi:hypothetical protein
LKRLESQYEASIKAVNEYISMFKTENLQDYQVDSEMLYCLIHPEIEDREYLNA